MNTLFLLIPIVVSILLMPLFSRGRSIVGAAIGICAGAVALLCEAVRVLSGWGQPQLPGVDPLSALFVVALALGGIASSVYAIGYLRAYRTQKNRLQLDLHAGSLVVLFYAMVGVVTSTQRYEFLFWWELMAIGSFLLILFDAQRKEVLHAAIGYLILMHAGFFLLLAGFSLSGDALFGSGSLSLGAFVLLFLGFALKAGVFPLHLWLPVAHPAAPAHVSALMSGVMIKMGIYGIVRAVTSLDDHLYGVGVALLIAGAVTALFGIVRAAGQDDLKRLLAYSSIENIGLMLLGIGFGTVGMAVDNLAIAGLGYGAALVHMLGHSNYKTLLFLGAGSIYTATHRTDMNRLGGLARRMPLSAILFCSATLAICAAPPLVGFSSEFLLFWGMFDALSAGQQLGVAIFGIVALSLVGGLVVITFVKAFGITFLGNPRSAAARDAGEVNGWMIGAQALPLAGLIAGAVCYPRWLWTIFDETQLAPFDTLDRILWVGGLLAVVVAALLAVRALLRRRSAAPVVEGPTWGCGFTAPSTRMQYTASSFARELEGIVAREKDTEAPVELEEMEIFPREHTFSTHESDTTARAVTRFSFRVLRKWTARLALFQTGKTNHYILHALLLLGAVLILSLAGLL